MKFINLSGPCIMCVAGSHDMCIHDTVDTVIAKKWKADKQARIKCPCAEGGHND